MGHDCIPFKDIWATMEENLTLLHANNRESDQPVIHYLGSIVVNLAPCKGVRALRGYFGPPMRSKNKSCSSQVSSCLLEQKPKCKGLVLIRLLRLLW